MRCARGKVVVVAPTRSRVGRAGRSVVKVEMEMEVEVRAEEKGE